MSLFFFLFFLDYLLSPPFFFAICFLVTQLFLCTSDYASRRLYVFMMALSYLRGEKGEKKKT